MTNTHTKRCSTELIIRDMKSKLSDTTSPWSEWPSLKSLQVTNAEEEAEKRKHFYTAGGNVGWCSHCGEQHGDSLKT